MRILHISTVDDAGAGMCCLRIHQSLLEAGVDSKVVVLKNTKHAEGEYQYGYMTDTIRRAWSKILRMFSLKITNANKVIALSREYKTAYTLPISSIDLSKCEWIEWADIIHLHWVNNFLDYPSFLKRVRKPIIWTLHDEGLFYGIAHHHKNILPNHPLEKKYRQVKYKAVRGAENLSFVFLSQMMFNIFGNEKIIEGRRVTIINNSVNTQVFSPKNRKAMRIKYGIGLQKIVFVLIAVDISDQNKGLDVLSKVLLDIRPDVEILAIGENPNHSKWQNVNSVGLVKDQIQMSELISCANYMAMPSYQEAFSQSPMEAMACGLPVVVFPVSGTSELVNEENGVICDDFTQEALKKGIETLMERQYDSIKIRQDMISRFSPNVIAQKYIDLYKNVLM